MARHVTVLLGEGGVAALQGKTNKILFFTALALGILAALGMASSGLFSIAGLLLGLAGIILRLVRANSSREFFNARGGSAI